MQHLRRRAWVLALPFLVVFGVVAAQLADPGDVVSRARNLVFDLYQRSDPRPYQDPRAVSGVGVKVIDIDEASLRRYGQWPWPRTRLARLAEQAARQGAKALAFDIVFAEADRTSPDRVPEMWPQGGDFDVARRALADLPRHDAVFAASLARLPVVTGVILTGESETPPAVKSGLSVAGGANKLGTLRALLPRYPGGILNLEEIGAAAAGLGALNIVPEPDGIVRRVHLVFYVAETLVPSLTLEALRVTGTQPGIALKLVGASGETGFGAETGIVQIKSGGRIIDTAGDGSIWLHFTGAAPGRRISALDFLEGRVPDEAVRDSVLLVGASAAGLRDLKPTPLSPAVPGVEIHAQALEQMLLGQGLRRPDYALGLEMLVALVLGGAVGALVLLANAYWAAPLAVAGIVAAWAGSYWAFAAERFLLDPLWPTLAVLGGFLIAALVNFLRTEAERRFVRGAFSHYLAPEVVDRLAAHPEALKLGGETRDMTIMFCDIRGFTPIAESYRGDPEGLTRLINRILTPLTRVVLDHKGTIDKYMGDCIMAFWNAPLDDPDHAANACRCALRIVEAVEALNVRLEAEHAGARHQFRPIEVGIGLNSGLCVVGNMGSDLRFDYSVLGDTVNVAARLQTYSANYGAAIAVSSETVARAGKGFTFLEVDRVCLKGRAEPVTVFTLLGTALAGTAPASRAVETAARGLLQAFRAGDWAGVRRALEAARQVPGFSSRLCELYDTRTAALETAETAPDWNGVWQAVEK